MIITIDTKADSPSDIRKAIAFLQLHVEDSGSSYVPTTAASTPMDTTTMMGMFDDTPPASNSPSASAQRTSDGSAPDFSSFLNLTKKERSASNVPALKPQIEFY